MEIEKLIEKYNNDLNTKTGENEEAIQNSAFKFNPENPEYIKIIEELENFIGQKLPADFLKYQYRTTEYSILWRYKKDEDGIGYYIAGEESLNNLFGIKKSTENYLSNPDVNKYQKGLTKLLKSGYYVFSQIDFFNILVRFEEDTHSLYLFLPNDNKVYNDGIHLTHFSGNKN